MHCHHCDEPGHLAHLSNAHAKASLPAPVPLQGLCTLVDHLGHGRGLFVNCELDCQACQALVDTGSDFIFVCPGVVRGTKAGDGIWGLASPHSGPMYQHRPGPAGLLRACWARLTVLRPQHSSPDLYSKSMTQTDRARHDYRWYSIWWLWINIVPGVMQCFSPVRIVLCVHKRNLQ